MRGLGTGARGWAREDERPMDLEARGAAANGGARLASCE